MRCKCGWKSDVRSSDGEHHELEPGVGGDWDLGNDHGCELWGDARNEHGDVQRDNGDSDELERDERCCAGASGSNDGKCCRDCRRSGEQWRELYGHDSSTEHHDLEPGVGADWDIGDDHRCELWADTGH